jgi:hypothetical protein
MIRSQIQNGSGASQFEGEHVLIELTRFFAEIFLEHDILTFAHTRNFGGNLCILLG